ncbi:MAG TPA: PAS domain-containing protein, partial [Steroidobacteraceae bacterium]
MKSFVHATANGLPHQEPLADDTDPQAQADERRRADREEADEPGLDTTIISLDTARMFKTLLSNLEGMVYRCRSADAWTMEFISEGCRRVTGYEPNDLLMSKRLTYESIVHPDDRQRVREEMRSGLLLSNRFDT